MTIHRAGGSPYHSGNRTEFVDTPADWSILCQSSAGTATHATRLPVMLRTLTVRFRFIATALSALLVGCAGSPLRIDAPQLPAPLIESLPLRIAVYLPPESRTYAYKDKYLTGLRFEIGAASAETLAFAFQAGFAQVIELDTPAATPLAGVDAILALETIDWSVVASAQQYTTLARYAFAMSTPGGEPIGRWETTQVVNNHEATREPGVAPSRKLSELLEVPSEVALEQVAAAFLLEFREQPQIRTWLESHQAYVPAMPGLPPASVAAESAAQVAPSGTAIYVTSDVPSASVRRCIVRELRKRLPGRPVMTGQSLRQALFPWLSHSLPMAATAERLAALVAHPAAVSHFNEVGVGRIVLVAGGTTQDWHGGGFCGGGYGGAGCLGLMWGERDSMIEAQVLDLSRPRELVHSQAHESGSAFLPMFLLPLPFIPATQSAACHELGKALADQLSE